MTMWIVIMWTCLSLTGAALVYLSTRVCHFEMIQNLTANSEILKAIVCGGIVLVVFSLIGFFINFMNAIVCAIYFALVWLVSDAAFKIIEKIQGYPFSHYYSGYTAIILTTLILAVGWYLDHHVWRTEYDLYTQKQVEPLKIVMFADSHTGTTFNKDGFAKHVEAMQAENPDIVVVAGDFVDDSTTRDDMLATAKILGNMQTKYGVYFVFGNHDNGYYGPEHRGFSGRELIAELEKNNVKVLLDSVAAIGDNFYLIGRKDYSVEREMHGARKSMSELVADLNKDKYMIVADHQPADYINQAAAAVDLVMSGHTHGGQLFPFNQVGKWIGANDLVYGHEHRNKTDFIVTSGISDWAIKFKTGTKSEYVVINIIPEK